MPVESVNFDGEHGYGLLTTPNWLRLGEAGKTAQAVEESHWHAELAENKGLQYASKYFTVTIVASIIGKDLSQTRKVRCPSLSPGFVLELSCPGTRLGRKLLALLDKTHKEGVKS